MPSVSISPAAALRALYWGAALLLLAAWLGPAVPQPQDFHAFADQRAWGALPHALDVLSNLGFAWAAVAGARLLLDRRSQALAPDRKSTRLNSSHSQKSYAVFCFKKKKKIQTHETHL